jgi:hypothetical protein
MHSDDSEEWIDGSKAKDKLEEKPDESSNWLTSKKEEKHQEKQDFD